MGGRSIGWMGIFVVVNGDEWSVRRKRNFGLSLKWLITFLESHVVKYQEILGQNDISPRNLPTKAHTWK